MSVSDASRAAIQMEMDQFNEHLAEAPLRCHDWAKPWTRAAMKAFQGLHDALHGPQIGPESKVAYYHLTTLARWNGRMAACRYEPQPPKAPRRK